VYEKRPDLHTLSAVFHPSQQTTNIPTHCTQTHVHVRRHGLGLQ